MNKQEQPPQSTVQKDWRQGLLWILFLADCFSLYLVLLFKKVGSRGKSATRFDGVAALVLYPVLLAQCWVPDAPGALTFPESLCLIYGSFLLLLAGHRFASLYQRYVRGIYEHSNFVGTSIFERSFDPDSALIAEIIAGFCLASGGLLFSTCLGGFLLVSAAALTVKNLVMVLEVHTLRDAISDAEIESDWIERIRRK